MVLDSRESGTFFIRIANPRLGFHDYKSRNADSEKIDEGYELSEIDRIPSQPNERNPGQC
ncbi:hypothetical protein C8N25_109110 [Algoriphagus antarcticus]|uniref:Uncharacterized protein n=1 Tax=Algoriphagus antarcticus TaxID=238540 RepID=A0A3E0DVG2_9BACT|nr:hypothetical protein C8N25_109110 [Algoriphagus antarcticus]